MIEEIQLGYIRVDIFIKIVQCLSFMSLNLQMDQNFPLICGFLKDFVKNYNHNIVY